MNKIISEYKSVLESLQLEYQSYEKILIALSGGVDSCLAAFLGRRFLDRENAIAVISNSASLKEIDFEIAIKFCKEHDIKYEVVYTNELENSNYTSNPENRCYFCKNELYDTLNKLVLNKYYNYNIINGNNYSDLGDYRPGLESATEQKVLSPFINCRITKSRIRDLAFHFNLAVWNKPASPCLSSRFPYGEEISLKKLNRVERGEIVLNEFGFKEVRVRSFGDSAIVEVPKEEIVQLEKLFTKIKEKIINIGFTNCEIDQEGFISGKMNRVLNEL